LGGFPVERGGEPKVKRDNAKPPQGQDGGLNLMVGGPKLTREGRGQLTRAEKEIMWPHGARGGGAETLEIAAVELGEGIM